MKPQFSSKLWFGAEVSQQIPLILHKVMKYEYMQYLEAGLVLAAH
jgi:hypothetical protein